MQAIFIHQSGGKQGERDRFERFPVRIGRSSSNDLVLTGNDTRASSRHAEVYFDGVDFQIKDLGSTNGTFLNGIRIRQARLRQGDIVEFGLGGPKLQFDSDKPEAAEIRTTDMNPISSPPPQLHNHNLSEKSVKEFGRDTVQVMLNRAVDLSSRRWKIALALSMGALVATIAIALFVQFYQKRTAKRDTVTSAAPKVLSFSEIASQNQRSIVLIYNRFELLDKNGNLIQEQISNGSGFVATRDGEIVTNRHVIEPWQFKSSLKLPPGFTSASGVTGRIKQLGVFFANDLLDPEHMYKVKDFELSDEADVAVLRIKPPRDLQPVMNVNDNMQALNQGDEIAVLAFPLGLELNELTQDKTAKSSLTRGIISKIPDNKKQIQLDVAAYEGSSGGPIFNSMGQVIGLLTSGPNDTLNFATPIRYATKLLKTKP
jgi:serine protease Do